MILDANTCSATDRWEPRDHKRDTCIGTKGRVDSTKSQESQQILICSFPRLSIYPRCIWSQNDGAVDSALLSDGTGIKKKGGRLSIRLVSLDSHARDG